MYCVYFLWSTALTCEESGINCTTIDLSKALSNRESVSTSHLGHPIFTLGESLLRPDCCKASAENCITSKSVFFLPFLGVTGAVKKPKPDSGEQRMWDFMEPFGTVRGGSAAAVGHGCHQHVEEFGPVQA